MSSFAESGGPQAAPGLRACVRGLPVPLALLDAELRYVVWSEAWEQAHDLVGAELAGKAYGEHGPAVPEEELHALRSCLQGTACDSQDPVPRPRPGGGVDYFRRRISPWHDAEGTRLGVSLYLERITEEVETRRLLREREGFIDLLFERASVGMNLCRLDGLWLESNPAFLEIIGYPRGEADGALTYWQLTPPEYAAQEAAQLEQLEASGRYGPYEKEFIRKDGTRVPVRLNGFLVERNGERFIWSLIEDISERRRFEKQYRAERIKAFKASKLAVLGELAAGVAHEINNPLAIIEGYVELLGQREPSPQLLEEALEKIGEANERAAQIVRSLRNIAREDRGALQEVSLCAVIRDTLQLYGRRFQANGVELRLALEADGEVRVRANELSQVLLNLLNNAYCAVEGGEQPWVELRTELRGGAIGVRVSDSGAGVPVELREKVFDPFFTTKEVGKGTGLGLSISQSLVSDFGGTLGIDAEWPTSSFLVELPLRGGASE